MKMNSLWVLCLVLAMPLYVGLSALKPFSFSPRVTRAVLYPAGFGELCFEDVSSLRQLQLLDALSLL